jgi:hypothetical protein
MATADQVSAEVGSAISVFFGERLLWEDRIRARVTVLTGNSKFVAVGCEDGSLYIYSPTGRYVSIFGWYCN